MAINKTLYVKDEDAPLWDKAKEYVGESLSAWVTEQIKILVHSNEARANGGQRIVLNYKERHTIPRSKAFSGRWLISPDEPYDREYSDEFGCRHWAMAATTRNNFVVFRFNKRKKEDDLFFPNGNMQVYPSLKDAEKDFPAEFIARAMEKTGVETEELYI